MFIETAEECGLRPDQALALAANNWLCQQGVDEAPEISDQSAKDYTWAVYTFLLLLTFTSHVIR